MVTLPVTQAAGAVVGGAAFSAGLLACWRNHDAAGLLAMTAGLWLLFRHSLALAFWIERELRSRSDESGPFAD